MSVLCRHPATDIERHFPFSAFEHNTGIIDESLAPEGLLVLYNASYLFRGSIISRHYQPIRPDTIGSNGFTTRHGRMGDVVAAYVYSDLEATYRIDDLSRIRFEDFIDCIYQKQGDRYDVTPKCFKVKRDPYISETIQKLEWSRQAVLNGLTQRLPDNLMDTRIYMRLLEDKNDLSRRNRSS